ncbi:cyclic phosphodiesterase-like protein-domain-containing protein [Suillus paluster]|uniref:cyclic phosphodiesterase-like protein-domain-containing protein n=1 Tax=Suillus paluster TaxID=48578 RepID=UPI001B87A77E|nr:cyclic phosphodiesterase-like protein-domain-containing protein [Suillus paluster]KAG1727071.1 cyclic phosphodiesterase-like protein-domain-containing protein [Suillus paluster]
MRCSLWLVPSEREHDALSCLMNFRPRHHRSKTHSSRSYPRFDPHVTLATFESSYKPKISLFLSPTTISVPVYFESMKVGNNYLSSLSIVVAKSRELMQLRDLVVEHLENNNMKDTSRSFPHMSLFYLDEKSKGDRQELGKQLERSERVRERTGRRVIEAALDCTLDGAEPEFDAMYGFEGSSIWLVDCTGGVEDWKVLEKQKLKSRRHDLRDVYLSRGEPFYSFSWPTNPVPVVTMPPSPRMGGRQPFLYGSNPLPMTPYYPPDPR